MRNLPDADQLFRDAIDFIFDCPLGRKALADPTPKDLAVFVRDAAFFIHKLTLSCHLPEFTDHGLTHLCSLLERVSHWTTISSSGVLEPLLERLSAEECSTLLLAVLFHDVGMLSQRPDDLPSNAPQWASKALNDVPNWVRSTHILRIEGVVCRGMSPRIGTTPKDPAIKRALQIAAAHGSWPWQPAFTSLSPRDGALAAILAIADLLDEDSNRCDITTLLNHRRGSELSRAHWIRHGLTVGRVKISSDEIQVRMQLIQHADPEAVSPIYSALRNHYSLALFYRDALVPIGGSGLKTNFGAPETIVEDKTLTDWNLVPGFATERTLSFQLLNTFFPIALLDRAKATADELELGDRILEPVNLKSFLEIRGNREPRTSYEQVARALNNLKTQ